MMWVLSPGWARFRQLVYIYEDSNDALQALSATYEGSSSVEPREGFLKKDEFLIILCWSSEAAWT